MLNLKQVLYTLLICAVFIPFIVISQEAEPIKEGLADASDDTVLRTIEEDQLDTKWATAEKVVDKPTIDAAFPSLVRNDGKGRESIFEINNPGKEMDISYLKINWDILCGKVNSYQILIYEPRVVQHKAGEVTWQTTCAKVDRTNNKTGETKEEEVCTWYSIDNTYIENRTETAFWPTKVVKAGLNTYKLQADIALTRCPPDGKFGYMMDWKPELLVEESNTKLEMADWAWWNATTHAQGGNVSFDGLYTVHTMLYNETFNISETIVNATILIVAGGGGSMGGGGGAGGLRYLTDINITTNMTVIVGQGGESIASERAGNGTSSWFGTSYNATGGGGGGYNVDVSALKATGCNGGSGGGGGVGDAALTVGGLGIDGQGKNGTGSSSHAANYPGGGGGGSGTNAALAPNTTSGGDGGNGTLINITGFAKYYAGGGGGGLGEAPSGRVVSKGGLGGGGNGTQGAGCTNGTNGLGGGGGGSGGNVAGCKGGSGVVIVRYLTPTPRAPTVEITLWPIPANVSSPIYCNVTVTDSDNASSIVDWSWLKDGVLTYSGTKTVTTGQQETVSILNNPGNVTVGENWNCTIQASDGSENSGNITKNISISNTLHTLTMKGIVYESDGTTPALGIPVRIYNDTSGALVVALTTNSTGHFNWSKTDWNGTSSIYYITAENVTNRSKGSSIRSFVNMSFV